MSYLAGYKKGDFKHVSWEEYGKTLDELSSKVSVYLKKENVKIDAVVPILRGGAFPGVHLAFRLKLLRILPVQYKYFFENKKILLRQISPMPKAGLPKNPTFLLVEQNHCFGITASTAVKDIKKEFPQCRIIYAADHIDYSYQKIDGVEAVFYGKLTNETRKLSKEECKKLGVFYFSYLFPWESIEEEWATVQGKQFEYGDTKEVLKTSETKKIIESG